MNKDENIQYAIGVYLSAVWEITALVQRIRCEDLIYWTRAVFSLTRASHI